MGSSDGGALIKAVQAGKNAEAEGLARANASVLRCRDEYGLSPIHWAALGGQRQMVLTFLALGDDARRKVPGDGTEPIHCAAQEGKTEVVELLLEKGVPIDATGGNDNTVLHVAARDGHAATVELLIRRGAALEARCDDDATPLDLASRGGHTQVIELLLQAGASAATKNRKGATPLHYAAFGGREKAIALLLAAGASTGARDMNGRTPGDLARMGGQAATFERLVAQQAAKGSAAPTPPKKDAGIRCDAAPLLLSEAERLGLLRGGGERLDPRVAAFRAELAGTLLRFLSAHQTPRGLDLRLVQRAFLFQAAKVAEARRLLSSGGEARAPASYSWEEFLNSPCYIGSGGADALAADRRDQAALDLFMTFQTWVVERTKGGRPVDVLGEVFGALEAVGTVAAQSSWDELPGPR